MWGGSSQVTTTPKPIVIFAVGWEHVQFFGRLHLPFLPWFQNLDIHAPWHLGNSSVPHGTLRTPRLPLFSFAVGANPVVSVGLHNVTTLFFAVEWPFPQNDCVSTDAHDALWVWWFCFDREVGWQEVSLGGDFLDTSCNCWWLHAWHGKMDSWYGPHPFQWRIWHHY